MPLPPTKPHLNLINVGILEAYKLIVTGGFCVSESGAGRLARALVGRRHVWGSGKEDSEGRRSRGGEEANLSCHLVYVSMVLAIVLVLT